MTPAYEIMAPGFAFDYMEQEIDSIGIMLTRDFKNFPTSEFIPKKTIDLEPENANVSKGSGDDADLSDLSYLDQNTSNAPSSFLSKSGHNHALLNRKAKQSNQPKKKTGTRNFPPRSHQIPKDLFPTISSHQFQSVPHRHAQVSQYLHRAFKSPTATKIHVDFDLEVAFFLQNTNHLNLGDIPRSVEKVLADYSLLAPLTSRQDALSYCTKYIKQTLDQHVAQPQTPKPFALRYPNLHALNQLAIEFTISPEIVGKDGAVVFLDVALRVVAVGVPPKKSKTASTLSGQEQGRIAFAGAAAINNLTVFSGPMTLETFKQTAHPAITIQSPHEVSATASSRLNGANSTFIEIPGCINGVLPSQAIGYGRYSSLAAGMSDTQMAFGKGRQGHPSTKWEEQDVSEFNLPTLIQMGKETVYKREAHSRVDSELLWHIEMGPLIIKAFQPKSYAAAMRCLQVIVQHGMPAASRKISSLINPVGIGRNIMYGMQVDHHRDGHNSNFFASANFFGQHYGGGESVLNYFGYAICGEPRYSVHGAFDILIHGVGNITRLPNVDGAPPQRICMAIYSHANIFAGAARFSGMQQEPKVFSDRNLWIPFYPDNFSMSQTLACIKAEERSLYGEYRDEVRRYQASVAAAKAEALAGVKLDSPFH